MADEQQLAILRLGADRWNYWYHGQVYVRGEHIYPDLEGADLTGTDLSRADLSLANLTTANLSGANLSEAKLHGANLSGADLTGANLNGAVLMSTRLLDADLSNALLGGAVLDHANLSGARLDYANLVGARLIRTNLSGANLSGANLEQSTLVETNLERATLIGCRTFGIAAWGLHTANAIQRDLTITPENERAITVDDLEIAQFIYLMLNNQNIRRIISTVANRAVLILGRFVDERRNVLERIKEALRNEGFVPILFDFDPSPERDLTETIQLLANLSRFIIADITDAREAIS